MEDGSNYGRNIQDSGQYEGMKNKTGAKLGVVQLPADLLDEIVGCLKLAAKYALKHDCDYEKLNSDLCPNCTLWSRVRYLTFKISQWTENEIRKDNTA